MSANLVDFVQMHSDSRPQHPASRAALRWIPRRSSWLTSTSEYTICFLWDTGHVRRELDTATANVSQHFCGSKKLIDWENAKMRGGMKYLLVAAQATTWVSPRLGCSNLYIYSIYSLIAACLMEKTMRKKNSPSNWVYVPIIFRYQNFLKPLHEARHAGGSKYFEGTAPTHRARASGEDSPVRSGRSSQREFILVGGDWDMTFISPCIAYIWNFIIPTDIICIVFRWVDISQTSTVFCLERVFEI